MRFLFTSLVKPLMNADLETEKQRKEHIHLCSCYTVTVPNKYTTECSFIDKLGAEQFYPLEGYPTSRHMYAACTVLATLNTTTLL